MSRTQPLSLAKPHHIRLTRHLGSDYPRDEGSFPHSQAVIERTFAGLSEADKRKIVWDNAARLYGFST